MEVYSFQQDQTLTLYLFKIENGHKFIIHKLESQIINKWPAIDSNIFAQINQIYILKSLLSAW